ncbi:hypothetical protein EWM64_g7436 [Hericium alpestre]|uniref:Uncharacterized protein n=1 Tax=Hericium alpestre TaxID=135208 RepID=A0A4Y9ZSW7_9AGAM|nr:hypothetical protein EWM64_g7436 [Hericium alpestre]
MKFSSALTSLIFLFPLLAGQASAGVTGRAAGQKNVGGKGGNNNGNKAAKGTAAAAGAAGGNAQTATTLDSAVVATGFAQDGQAQQVAGQVASLTSTNNFINFCATVPNMPITNGQQIKTGSCNPAPMGVIASTSNIPSSKFTNPKNMDNLPANQKFTISMAVSNLQMGNFVNANTNYYSAPQQLNAQGDIIGHTHVVIEKLDSLAQTTPTNPLNFAFFKGVNTAAVNGAVTADVDSGLPAGTYRLASINAAANHQPVLVAVAQHGTLDDMVYFTVGGAGAAAANTTAGAAKGSKGGKGGAASAAASSAAASSTAAAGAAGKGQQGGKGNNGAAKGNNGAAKGGAGAGAANGAAAGAGAGAAKGGAGNKGAKGRALGSRFRRSRLARES